MKIAIVDADLLKPGQHKFPNLACMKLSGFYKEQGNDVELITGYWQLFQNSYDRIFLSKVFVSTSVPKKIMQLPNLEYGGTGFFFDEAPALPNEIEHHMPDYHLYDEWVREQLAEGVSAGNLAYYTDYSIGFTTRGCIRHCGFCVNRNKSKAVRHSPISEFYDSSRPFICLYDDNVLACPDWKEIFKELNATGKPFQYKQGMDERLLTEEKCEIIFNSRWKGDFIFAFDNIRDKDLILTKLNMIKRHTDKWVKFYCLCGYNHENPGHYDLEFWKKDIADLFERIYLLLDNHCLAYVMRYEDYKKSPYRSIYIAVSRWCNQPNLLKVMSFKEFCLKLHTLGSATHMAYRLLRKEMPEVAEKYIDAKMKDTE